MAGVKVTCMAIVICMMLMGAPFAVNAISCSEVIHKLDPCLGYLGGSSSAPSRKCCRGVKKLNHMARTTRERRTTCNCLKSAANAISGLRTNNAAALPGMCGVRLSYKISTSTNCNRIRN
ncbi:non-specific lipid-transfer protein 1 [Cicer arietinum]|uniref:Non-specific lipid-transfer protein n=1 Tax=Cicer arietinum TaxID=3827 RepID=A0A1S2YLJ8_CICAR|nr:non-specific lipid-transfer protein 1 [Cicer arietinum]